MKSVEFEIRHDDQLEDVAARLVTTLSALGIGVEEISNDEEPVIRYRFTMPEKTPEGS